MPKKNKYIENVTSSNGGGNILIDIIRKFGIMEFIDEKLGSRAPRAEYTYAQGMISLLLAQLKGHKRIEDLYHCREDLINHPRFQKGMSPDTLLYMCKELATENELFEIIRKEDINDKRKKKYKNHEVNVLTFFNELMLDTAIKLDLLNKFDKYVLDFDATEITTKIKDGRRSYKKTGKKAICPAVAMIDNIPIYIENRNGNSPARFRMVETLQEVLTLLKSRGIIISTIRIDSAGYMSEVFSMAERMGIKVVVRAVYPAVRKEISSITNWREVIVKGKVLKIGSTVFRLNKQEYKLIVKELLNPITEVDEDGVEHETKHWGLATNDFDRTEIEILNIYELRGDSENLFRGLNEFGWKILPMRNLKNNTVYLCMTAVNWILFQFFKKYLSSKVKCVNETMRLPTFTKVFMPIATKWVKGKLRLLSRIKEFKTLLNILQFDSG